MFLASEEEYAPALPSYAAFLAIETTPILDRKLLLVRLRLRLHQHHRRRRRCLRPHPRLRLRFRLPFLCLGLRLHVRHILLLALLHRGIQFELVAYLVLLGLMCYFGYQLLLLLYLIEPQAPPIAASCGQEYRLHRRR